MREQTSLQYISAFAILGLFVVDTRIISTQYTILNSILFTTYMGALFFALAYISGTMLNEQRRFWFLQFKKVYLPYAILVTFAVLTYKWLQPSFQTWFFALTPISILEEFKPETLGYLWFIPLIVGFFILFAFLHKYVPNDRAKAVILISIWTYAVLSRHYGNLLHPIDEFPLFLPVFSFGYFLSKGTLDKFKISNVKTILAASLIALVSFIGYYYIPELRVYLNTAGVDYYGVSTLLTISLMLILTYLLRNAKPNRIILSISSSIVIIYLLEPYVSTLVTFLFYNNMDYYQAETTISIIARIPITIAIAVLIQYGIINRLRK